MNRTNLMVKKEGLNRIKPPEIDKAILKGLSIVLLICQLMYYSEVESDSTLWLIRLSGGCFILSYFSYFFKGKERLIDSICLNLIGFYSFAAILGWFLFNKSLGHYSWYFFLCSAAYVYQLINSFDKGVNEISTIASIEILMAVLVVFSIKP